MNVLQVYKTHYPEVAGGVDTVVTGLLHAPPEQYRARLLETAAWTLRGSADRTVDGVAVHALHLPLPGRGRAALAFLWRAPGALLALRRLVRNAAIDVIHLHTLQHYHVYFMLLRRLGGPPYVITLHRAEVLAYPTRGRLTRWIWQRSLQRAAAVVAVAAWLAAQARRTWPDLAQVDVVENGIAVPDSPVDSSALARRLGLPARYCVMVGACEPYKAHAVGFAAWAQLPARHADIGLVVVGDGPLRAAYQAELAARDLAGRVHCVGRLSHADTLALMRGSLGLVMPSRSEGQSIALLEAGAVGIALVCSDIEPFREVVVDGVTALLFTVDDPAALAQAVTRLLDQPALAAGLAQALAAQVRERHALDVMRARYAVIYRRVAAAS